jgi:hypothetical protein
MMAHPLPKYCSVHPHTRADLILSIQSSCITFIFVYEEEIERRVSQVFLVASLKLVAPNVYPSISNRTPASGWPVCLPTRIKRKSLINDLVESSLNGINFPSLDRLNERGAAKAGIKFLLVNFMRADRNSHKILVL